MAPEPITDAATLAELLLRRFRENGRHIALHAPGAAGGDRTLSWAQLEAEVLHVARELRAAGIEHGDRVAQFSENRLEWILVDFACLLEGAVHVPLHASLSPQQAIGQIRHSGARLAFVSSPAQAARLMSVREQWPDDLALITYERCPGLDRCRGQLQLVGDSGRGGEGSAPRPRPDVSPETLATILYTSGTTGEPKGVMLTHGNFMSNAVASTMAFGQQRNEVKLGFLPLSHVFARTCDLYSWLVRGGELVIASSREKVLEECTRFQPTCLNGVPYFYERLQRALCEKKLDRTPGVLRQMLGGRIRFCNSGGAPLMPHLFDFFHEQGVPLLEGYGLSETSPVITLSTPDRFRRGSCGQPIEGVEVAIADDGEILTRGPHVMHGYYRNPQATQEIFSSGWLKTGDLGFLDEEGYLFITGRKKELIVLSSGKNIAPTYLESLLLVDPLIAQAMVIGDRRSYLTALIVPDMAALKADRGREIDLATEYPRFGQRIAHALRDTSHHEQIRRFTLLPEPFSLERGELTPKLSLRRAVIEQHYATEIEAMYERNDPCA